MSKVFIGIDNGVSGTIGIVSENETIFVKTPTKSEQNYTKAKGNITRVDVLKLAQLISPYISIRDNVYCLIERPMVNPSRFQATTSALRALEATLNVIESMGYSYSYCDSKEWQKELLPKGSSGEQLKTDSRDIAKRLFPKHSDLIEKHKDGDGILIAEYCRRKFK